MKYIKLSQYAKNTGICYMTAYQHYKKGLIPNTKTLPTGTMLVGVEDTDSPAVESNNIRVALYARVSGHDMKDNLVRQIERLTDYAIAKGYTITHSVTEIASGMNDTRPKFITLLNKTDYDVLLVEHKDRLTRFGFNYIDTLLRKQNMRVEVINEVDNDNENLMNDLISIIYSFSSRMYGKRRKTRKTEQIIKELKKLETEDD